MIKYSKISNVRSLNSVISRNIITFLTPEDPTEYQGLIRGSYPGLHSYVELGCERNIPVTEPI